MDKRGDFLLEEGAKIIMAVLGLIVLFGLGFALFSLTMQKTANNQAKEHLDVITNTIENMDAENNFEEYVLLSPKGWSLVAWPITLEDGTEFKPSNCKGDNCVCMCPQEKNYLVFFDTEIDSGSIFKRDETGGGITSLSNLKSLYNIKHFLSDTKDICEEQGFCKQLSKKSISQTPVLFGDEFFTYNTISINDLMKNKQTVKFYYTSENNADKVLITNQEIEEPSLNGGVLIGTGVNTIEERIP